MQKGVVSPQPNYEHNEATRKQYSSSFNQNDMQISEHGARWHGGFACPLLVETVFVDVTSNRTDIVFVRVPHAW